MRSQVNNWQWTTHIVTLLGCLAIAGSASGAMLGYWNFNDAADSTVALDTSGGGNTGTIAGPAAYTPAGGGHSGLPGDYAMDYGTVNNGARVQVGSAAYGAFNSMQANNAATVSLWIKGHASQPQNDTAFGFYVGTTRQFQAHMPWSNQNIYFDVGGCCSGGVHRINKLESDSTKWEGGWNHYAFVKNGNQSEIYQNGTLWHNGTTTAPIGQIVSAYIGSEVNATNSYAGQIDDFAVWDEALASPQIADLASGALSPAAFSAPTSPYYDQVVLADGPMAYYRFDNDTGANGTRLADFSGNNRNGDYVNPGVVGPENAVAPGGSGVRFDGRATYARGTTVQATTAVTVEAWAKSDSENWNESGFLVSKRDSYILHPNSGSKTMQFYVHASGGWTPVAFDLGSIPGFDIREWHHYAGAYDPADTGRELKLYVDGALRATTSKTGAITASSAPTYVGYDVGTRYYRGAVDEVAIYDRALTAGELTDHFLAAPFAASEGPTTIVNLARLGTASQLTTDFGGDARRAVDGGTDGQYFYDATVSHTNTSTSTNSWQLDLGGSHDLQQIDLFSRTDWGGGRLNELHVSVLDGTMTEVFGYDLVGPLALGEGTSISLPDGTSGRFVRIQRNGPDTLGEWSLQFAEVRVMGETAVPNGANLARLYGTAGQSSTLANSYAPGAQRAVDGNTSGVFNNATVTHTNSELTPSWTVDLTGNLKLDHVNLFERTDSCCNGRLNDFRVSVLDASMAEVFGQDVTGGVDTRLTVPVPYGTEGRYVRIQMNDLGSARSLELAEVEVIGGLLENVARNPGAVARQSSTRIGSGGNEARFAIDGNPDPNWSHGSITHTLNEPDSWWEVALGGVYDLDEVILYNRDVLGLRLSNFRMSVFKGEDEIFGEDFFTTPGTGVLDGANYRIPLPEDVFGDRIRVQLLGFNHLTGNGPGVLSLAEVQAFGVLAPEPASWLLFGLGSLALLAIAARRRRSSWTS